jgi:hypothetical protein
MMRLIPFMEEMGNKKARNNVHVRKGDKKKQ